MIQKKEMTGIIIAVVLMALILGFSENELKLNVILSSLLISAIVILISVFAKKITASYLDLELENKTWEFRRYGISAREYLKRPFPIGLILPLLLAFISGGVVKFLALLQFEVKTLPSRVAKKYGLRRFSGIMEWDDALIAFYSAVPLLILAIACSYVNAAFFISLAKFSFLYVFSNLLPISKLDGTRLFFGSKPLFIFTWILVAGAYFIVFF